MEETSERFVYYMDLHDVVIGANRTKVLRVPGGWIYSDSYYSESAGVFVPYNDEFKGKE